MKKFIYLITGMFLFSLLFLNACTYTPEKTIQETQGPEYTSAYVCPMHCEGSGSDSMGTCPVCNMDYVPNKDN